MSERVTSITAKELYANRDEWAARKDAGECSLFYDGERVDGIDTSLTRNVYLVDAGGIANDLFRVDADTLIQIDWLATPQPPVQGGEGADAEVELMRLIKLGKKVDAIYLHRRLYNSGLREASDAVDAMAENRPTYAQLETEVARLQAENDALRKLCGDAADILEGSGLFIQQELKAAAKDGGK